MDSNTLITVGTAVTLALVQVLAALPWLAAVDPRQFRRVACGVQGWLAVLGVVLLGGVGIAGALLFRADPAKLEFDGRVFASILHLQLGLDLILVVLWIAQSVWPKGGTVAHAAFREGYRQPMFWFIAVTAMMIIAMSMVVPYFTLGDDFKMMKQISFDVVKLAAVLFVVLAACMSVSEEIEGRTAVTLMSKPVTRRQFLLGKYFGVLLAGALLTLILGWWQNWALYIKPHFDRLEDSFDPLAVAVQDIVAPYFERLGRSPETRSFLKGVGLWGGETLANAGGLALGFSKVMIMLAVSVSLATRLPMIVSLLVSLFFYVLGNLAPILAVASEKMAQRGAAMGLVNFLAQLLDKIMPAFNFFLTDQVFFRESYLRPSEFAAYVLQVLSYAVLYSAMALLGGLYLIEDRDLA